MIRRRQFIKNCASMPFSLYLTPQFNSFANETFPKRLITIFTPNGQFAPTWFPNYPVNPNKKRGEVDIYPLKDFLPKISPVLGEWMNPYIEKMNLIRGLDIIPVNRIRDHWPEKMNSGYGDQHTRHETIDQLIAYSNSFYNNYPALRSLELKMPGEEAGDLKGATISCRRIKDVVSPVFPSADPTAALDRLFRNVTISESILDEIYSEIKSRKSSASLEKKDRDRLDQYMTLLQEVNAKQGRTNSGKMPNLEFLEGMHNRPSLLRAHFKVIEYAIKFDLCRVFALSIGEAAEGSRYTFITGGGAPWDYHALTHENAHWTYYGDILKIHIWQSKMIAELLELLDTVENPDTGETFLDNTLIYWSSCTSSKPDLLGNDNNHRAMDMPCVLFGKAGGNIKTGNFIDFMSGETRVTGGRAWTYPQFPGIGQPLNRLLITIMMAMGLTEKDWEENNQQGFGDYSENEHNAFTTLYDPLYEVIKR